MLIAGEICMDLDDDEDEEDEEPNSARAPKTVAAVPAATAAAASSTTEPAVAGIVATDSEVPSAQSDLKEAEQPSEPAAAVQVLAAPTTTSTTAPAVTAGATPVPCVAARRSCLCADRRGRLAASGKTNSKGAEQKPALTRKELLATLQQRHRSNLQAEAEAAIAAMSVGRARHCLSLTTAAARSMSPRWSARSCWSAPKPPRPHPPAPKPRRRQPPRRASPTPKCQPPGQAMSSAAPPSTQSACAAARAANPKTWMRTTRLRSTGQRGPSRTLWTTLPRMILTMSITRPG
jgi:hypothetical protein